MSISEGVSEMKKGIVKWFNVQKRFGFLTVEGEKNDLFFHFNDGYFIDPGKDKPVFSSATKVRDQRVYPLRDPKQGEEIIFEESKNAQGPIAKPWGYYSTWVKAEEWIKAHPAPPPIVYRVLATMNNVGEPEGEPTVGWEGDNLEQLRRQYPRNSHRDDRFLSFWADSDGIFETHHRWEKKNEAGAWEPCADPR